METPPAALHTGSVAQVSQYLLAFLGHDCDPVTQRMCGERMQSSRKPPAAARGALEEDVQLRHPGRTYAWFSVVTGLSSSSSLGACA